jgi:hypothetical protein
MRTRKKTFILIFMVLVMCVNAFGGDGQTPFPGTNSPALVMCKDGQTPFPGVTCSENNEEIDTSLLQLALDIFGF